MATLFLFLMQSYELFSRKANNSMIIFVHLLFLPYTLPYG